MATHENLKYLLPECSGRLGQMLVCGLADPMMSEAGNLFLYEYLKRIGGYQQDFERLNLQYTKMLEEAGCEFLLNAYVIYTVADDDKEIGLRVSQRTRHLR